MISGCSSDETDGTKKNETDGAKTNGEFSYNN
jgi:hypothetical protein